MKEDNNTSDKLKECFSKLAETIKIPQQKPNPNTQVILFKHQLKSIKSHVGMHFFIEIIKNRIFVCIFN